MLESIDSFAAAFATACAAKFSCCILIISFDNESTAFTICSSLSLANKTSSSLLAILFLAIVISSCLCASSLSATNFSNIAIISGSMLGFFFSSSINLFLSSTLRTFGCSYSGTIVLGFLSPKSSLLFPIFGRLSGKLAISCNVAFGYSFVGAINSLDGCSVSSTL